MGVFRNKNYTFMFLGRIVSNIGDSLYAVAAMLLVYELGGSTFYTGLAGFLSLLPRIVEFCSGPFIDKIPIRALLVRSQLLQSGLLLIIPVAALLDLLNVALVLTITPLISSINVLIYPAQLAALPTILPESDLVKGNSFFTLAYQGVDITFNGLAGILFVAIGPVALYLTNSVAFLVGALLFAQIRLPEKKKELSKGSGISQQKKGRRALASYLHELKEGASILLQSFLLKLLLGVIVLNMVGGATFAVLPAYGQKLGGAQFVGFLLMAQAIGSLLGALMAPFLKLERYPLGKLYAFGFMLSGFFWAWAVWLPGVWLPLFVYMLAWVPGGALNIIIFTTIQRTIPKALLGRVFTAATSLSGVAAPFGYLLGGSLGVWIGSAWVISLSGVIVIGIALYWYLDLQCRRLPATQAMDQRTFFKDLSLEASASIGKEKEVLI